MLFKFLSWLKHTPIGKYYFNIRAAKIYFGIAKGFKRRGGLGILGLRNNPDSKEVLFIKSLDLTGKVVYDIGANFGAFTLYFCKAVGSKGKVVAFDPLKKNCDDIAFNLKLNKLNVDNVQIIQKGVGSKKESLTLAFDPQNTSVASFEANLRDEISKDQTASRVTMEVDSIDNMIQNDHLPEPDFIKIDVEGFEQNVLLGMKDLIARKHPQLFIEVHGAGEEEKRRNALALYTFLHTNGYSVKHVETETELDSTNTHVARAGHLYCTFRTT